MPGAFDRHRPLLLPTAHRRLGRARGGAGVAERGEESAVPGAFDRHRPLLFSIAYRMLGSVMEAEDAVQEAYLRWRGTSGEEGGAEEAERAGGGRRGGGGRACGGGVPRGKRCGRRRPTCRRWSRGRA